MRGIEEGVRSRGNDRGEENQISIPKKLELANTAFSFIWWIIGFYWVSTGAKTLNHDAPQLYWLCIVFLAFDVFFVAFCVSLACAIGLLVCCCFPCITTVLYMVPDKEGASEEEIRQLPKYKFRKVDDSERFASEISGRCGGIMTELGNDPPKEHVVQPEDAECCICVSPYDDGAELRGLPCNHHFHLDCIEKWLQINATCPLCKFSITESSSREREEV